MTEHILKTLPDYYEAVERGDKTFEVRRDDRGFQKGDTLVLRKLARDTWGKPTIYVEYVDGKPVEQRVRVLWVLSGGQFGIEPAHVVMSIEKSRPTPTDGAEQP
jgi:hypothetical protein